MSEVNPLGQEANKGRGHILKRLVQFTGTLFSAAFLLFASVFLTLYFGVGGPLSPWWDLFDSNFFIAYGVFAFAAVTFALASGIWFVFRCAQFFHKAVESH